LVLLLNRGIEMIDLTNWTENDAQLWARNNGILLQIEQEFNDEYEEGRVISQSVACRQPN
jgi:beta-lactam-binding protein with PASTA domain